MSEALASLLDARANIDAAIAALGGETEAPVTGGLDDPLTAPLTVDGLWVPPLLTRLITATKKKYPDGYTDPQPQIDGSRRRVPVIWPKGLVLQLCRKRDDLTEDQAHMIQFCNPIAFTQTLIDSGHDLNYRPLDFPMLGGFVGALASLYDLDLPRLERDLRRWFWLRWVVEVDGDTGGV